MDTYCEIIVRDDAIFVLGMIQTLPGVRLAGQPVTKLPRNVSADDLGQALLKTLTAFHVGRHPNKDEMKAMEAESLRGTGFKTWKALSKNAHRLGVKAGNAAVEITPSVSDGRGGSISLEDDKILTALAPNEIGEAVMQAIALCLHKSRLP